MHLQDTVETYLFWYSYSPLKYTVVRYNTSKGSLQYSYDISVFLMCLWCAVGAAYWSHCLVWYCFRIYCITVGLLYSVYYIYKIRNGVWYIHLIITKDLTGTPLLMHPLSSTLSLKGNLLYEMQQSFQIRHQGTKFIIRAAVCNGHAFFPPMLCNISPQILNGNILRDKSYTQDFKH